VALAWHRKISSAATWLSKINIVMANQYENGENNGVANQYRKLITSKRKSAWRKRK
jgi:hypothetical protein